MKLLQMFLTTLSLLTKVLSASQQLKFIYKQPKVSAKSDVNLEINRSRKVRSWKMSIVRLQ